MRYLKISAEKELLPIDSLWDLIAKDRRHLFYTIENQEDVTRHYPIPPTNKAIRAITIIKRSEKLDVEIQTTTDGYFVNIDPKRYAKGHFDLLRRFHSDALVNELLKRITVDGTLIHPINTVLRVATMDDRIYALYQGVVFGISLNLRLSRIGYKIPDARVKEIQDGYYSVVSNSFFTYEKRTIPCKDLTFHAEKSSIQATQDNV
jgi:hypothetical protein